MEKTKSQTDLNREKRLSLKVETALTVGIQGIDYRLGSTVIGISHDKYLLIEIPTNPSFFIFKGRLSEGTFLIVRYLYQGAIIDFKSEILTLINYPEDLVFLKYPRLMEKFNLRATKRGPCFLQASLLKSDNKQVKGALLDVSASGCLFFIKDSDEKDPIFLWTRTIKR